MIFYVAYSYNDETDIEKAKKIVRDLQVNDLENCYICPLLIFSNIGYQEIDYEERMNLHLDLLSFCDRLIVASNVNETTQREIAFAELVEMEVEYLENS